MTVATTVRRSFYDAVIGDLVDLVQAQPHQVLISSASVAIVASEAAALIPVPFNVLMAVGAEWAYLRGLASSPRGSRGWVAALNWGALILVVLYGMLWGARKFGALPDEPAGAGAWLLTAAHILPVAFLSLAAAQVHRSAVEAEAVERATHEAEAAERATRLQLEDDERQRRRQERLDEIEAQRLAKLADVEAMEAAANARQRVRQAFAPNSLANTSPPALAASGSPANSDRRALIERVANTLREQPTTNKAQLARDLGVGRTTLYELIAEARAAGLLPAE